jgi:hypothetical protein
LPIEEGQGWVHEKTFKPAFVGLDPTYQRYHAELSRTKLLEKAKHLMEAENARITASCLGPLRRGEVNEGIVELIRRLGYFHHACVKCGVSGWFFMR